MVLAARECMTKIDLSMTKAELQLLIKLAYTGFYVCDREDYTEARKRAIEQLIDRLLQLALSYKALEGIEFDARSGKHYLDADHEESLLEDYGEFIEESFWDELIYRLGRRDLANVVGEKALSNMELGERIEKEEQQMEKYRREFETNGVNRLEIPK
jgi:hypothetical protein